MNRGVELALKAWTSLVKSGRSPSNSQIEKRGLDRARVLEGENTEPLFRVVEVMK